MYSPPMSTSVPAVGARIRTDIVVEGGLLLHCFPLDIVSPVLKIQNKFRKILSYKQLTPNYQFSGRFPAIVLIDFAAFRILSAAIAVLAESGRWSNGDVFIDIPSASAVSRGKPIVTVPSIVRIAAGVPAVGPRRSIEVLLLWMHLLVMMDITLVISHIRRSAPGTLHIHRSSCPVVLLVSSRLLVVP